MFVGNFPESLSQAILVGAMLVGGLGETPACWPRRRAALRCPRTSQSQNKGCVGEAVAPRRLGLLPRMVPKNPQAAQHIN